MRKPELMHWKEVNDHMHNSKSYPSVSLLTDYFGISCSIKPNGTIKLSTRSGGGHGEGNHDDEGRDIVGWANLLSEAEYVRKHYWGK